VPSPPHQPIRGAINLLGAWSRKHPKPRAKYGPFLDSATRRGRGFESLDERGPTWPSRRGTLCEKKRVVEERESRRGELTLSALLCGKFGGERRNFGLC